MEDAINEAMFEFAFTCQHLIQRGWHFVDIKYGERRLGIGPSLTIKKDDVTKTIYHHDDLVAHLNDEITRGVFSNLKL